MKINEIIDPIRYVAAESALSGKFTAPGGFLVDENNTVIRLVSSRYNFRSANDLANLLNPLQMEGFLVPGDPDVFWAGLGTRLMLQYRVNPEIVGDPSYEAYVTVLDNRRNGATRMGIMPMAVWCSNAFANVYTSLGSKSISHLKGEDDLRAGIDILKLDVADSIRQASKTVETFSSYSSTSVEEEMYRIVFGSQDYKDRPKYKKFVENPPNLGDSTEPGIRNLGVVYTQLTHFLTHASKAGSFPYYASPDHAAGRAIAGLQKYAYILATKGVLTA